MKALPISIMARFDSVPAGLKSILTGGLHQGLAPQGAQTPYGVFLVMGGDTDALMDRARVQFTLYDYGQSSARVYDAFAALDALFDGYSPDGLGTPGNLGFTRAAPPMVLPDDGAWKCIVEYEIWIERQ